MIFLKQEIIILNGLIMQEKFTQKQTHHKGKPENDVSDFYELAFAVLMEEIRILRILPESFESFE